MRAFFRLLPLAPFVLALAPKPTPTPSVHRIAVRYCNGTDLPRQAFGDATAPIRRGDVEIQAAPEGTPVPKGADVVHVCVLPVPEAVKALAARYPVTLQDRGFAFDGRTYSEPGDAILLTDPARPAETLVLGISLEPAAMLASQRIRGSDRADGDYVIVTGPRGMRALRKRGRFTQAGGALAIDRASDRDQIADRDAYYGSLGRVKKGVVTAESVPADKARAEKWLAVAAKFAGKKPFLIRLFPDTVSKATFTGSSRPADVIVEQGVVRVEVDATAPESPDQITPALAAAVAAAAKPQLAERPILLMAIGARRVGTWWGRDVKSFGAFALAAKVEPSIDEVLGAGEDVSPVLGVGAAAAWLDAGARLESEQAVEKALAGKDADLVSALTRWREIAWRQPVKPPARRPLPEGFVAGVAYIERTRIDESFVSPASAKTLEGLRALGATSVAVMPEAFASDEKSDRLSFVRGGAETDEAIVRVISDARAAGLSAMVKPRVEVGNDFALGRVELDGEQSWHDWFASYRRFVVHHAVVAEAAGAAIFCAGDELSPTEVREKDWRFVFSALRLATGAPLVYAPNGASRVLDITFWDALDAIGVDFFDPLGKGNDRLSDLALTEGVKRAAGPLAQASRKYSNKAVILTEAGYPHVRAPWLAPADEDSSRPYATDDAARCVAAVYRALGKEPWWRGVYWSKAFSDGDPAVPGVKGFNFIGTPVEKAISEGWRDR